MSLELFIRNGSVSGPGFVFVSTPQTHSESWRNP